MYNENNNAISVLPDELWLTIFSFFNQKQLKIVAQVNSDFNRISKDDNLFKIKFPTDITSLVKNKNIVVGYTSNTVYIYDITNKKMITLKNVNASYEFCTISPANAQIMLIHKQSDDKVKADIWNIATQTKQEFEFKTDSFSEKVKGIQFVSNNLIIFFTTHYLTEYFCNTSKFGAVLQYYTKPTSFGISQNGRWMWFSGAPEDKKIYIFDEQNIFEHLDGAKFKFDVSISTYHIFEKVTDNGKYIIYATKSADHIGDPNLDYSIITIYDREKNCEIKSIFTPMNILSLDITKNGKYIVVAGKNAQNTRMVNIYDSSKQNDKECTASRIFKNEILKVFFYEDGVIIGCPNEIKFLDYSTLGLDQDFNNEELSFSATGLSM